MILIVLMLVVSVFVIWRACDAFDTAANHIGRNMSGGIRGATLNAAGSSMPELITLVLGILVFGDRDGIAVGIGTIAGSAIYNIAVIPALAIVAAIVFAKSKKVSVNRRVLIRDTSWLIGVQIIFISLLVLQFLGIWGGLFLALVYVAYVIYLLSSLRKSRAAADQVVADTNPDDASEAPVSRHGSSLSAAKVSRLTALLQLRLTPLTLGKRRPDTSPQAWSLLVVAIAAIGFACWVLVEAVYRLGDLWLIEPYFLAVIVAAAATSIPDTILSVNDAMRGEYEDALSNAIGSNIFNISFGIGFPVLLAAVVLGVSSNMPVSTLNEVVPLLILLVPIYAVIGWMLSRPALSMLTAFWLILIYALYVAYIILQALGLITFPIAFG